MPPGRAVKKDLAAKEKKSFTFFVSLREFGG
jgi:hypothetical protein